MYVYGWGGVSVGPAVCLGLGAISMKEDWVQGAYPHSHTQTSYASTGDNTQRQSYMPATIVVACSLLSPMLVFSVAFYWHWGKGYSSTTRYLWATSPP